MAEDPRPSRSTDGLDRARPPRLCAFGEAAWLVDLGGGIDPSANAAALALAAAVVADARPGWGRPLPAYDSVLVPFEPERLVADEARSALEGLLADVLRGDLEPTVGRTHRIGVRYGGQDGPDLATAAARLGLTPVQLVEAHTAQAYRVFVLGFAPGFAYLGPLPEALRVPRHERPRPRVPAGSVAIAGAQTAIYPGGTAGGWQVLGRTDVRVWDVARDPPALLQPGDLVRFEPRSG